MAARRREKLIEAPFELCTKGHEANRLDDTCVDGGGAEVSARGYGWATVKLRKKVDDGDDGEIDSKGPIDRRNQVASYIRVRLYRSIDCYQENDRRGSRRISRYPDGPLN